MHLHVEGPTYSGEINVGFVAPQLCGSIAASYAICDYLGMAFSDFAAAMAGFALPVGRGRLVRIDRPVPFSLLDDSYNANPSSMKAAIDALGHHQGRKVVLLGDMLELGGFEEEAHQEVVHRIIEIGVDIVVAVGPAMSQAFEAKKLPNKVICVDSIDDALVVVRDLIEPSDLVLAKGSHGSGIYRIVARLLDGGQDGVATT
jgi:UDP-N-acetylmuramyl pentapeptide synthase